MGNGDWGRNEVRAVAADNNLLCALKHNDLELLLPNLGRAEHPAGDILYEPGDSVDHAYFPCGQAWCPTGWRFPMVAASRPL